MDPVHPVQVVVSGRGSHSKSGTLCVFVQRVAVSGVLIRPALGLRLSRERWTLRWTYEWAHKCEGCGGGGVHVVCASLHSACVCLSVRAQVRV